MITSSWCSPGWRATGRRVGGAIGAYRLEAFHRQDYADELAIQKTEAERRFREIVDRFPSTDAAAEALYWAGVSKYKSGDASALRATAAAFRVRYQDTTWAKKASVWG